MDCKVTYLSRSEDPVSLVMKGRVYKFTPSAEHTMDESFGKIIENLPDKSLRSKFKVSYCKEMDVGPTFNIEERVKPLVAAAKKKRYSPKNTRQESIV